MKALKLAIAGLAVFTAMSAPVQAENTFAKPPKFWWPDRIDLTPLRQHAPSQILTGRTLITRKRLLRLI